MGMLPMVRGVRRVFWRAIVAGASTQAAAAAAGVSFRCGHAWFVKAGGMPPLRLVEPCSGRYLSLPEREEIAVGIAAGKSLAAIAAGLGRARSTIGREVARNLPVGCRDRRAYRAVSAQQRADVRAGRPKPRKLAVNARLRGFVQAGLEQRWSPEQIAARLDEEFPDEPEMRVSHEAIYQALYVQGRGGLRRELTRCLRTGRALRKPRRRGDRRKTQRIPGMVMISDRPAEAADRAVPGHWEGDLIIGRNNASAIGTLVERATRYVLLLHLPDGYDAVHVETAMRTAITDLPQHLWRSLTWDQGIEMARHHELTLATGLPIYFCDPHSPWQRGSNENTNGLLRQYFPKGTDLSLHSAAHLTTIAAQLNGRPRKTLGWRTPAEALNQLLSTPFNPPGVATTA
jgi:transposase, IS30 family